MKCEAALPELVAYHFGVLEADARGALEEHLLACPRCVRAFVEIKRAIELGEDVPSPRARAKLRGSVLRELGLAKRRWWERPLAVALAASVVLFAGASTHAIATSPGAPPYALSR